jgi:hypothetical protein
MLKRFALTILVVASLVLIVELEVSLLTPIHGDICHKTEYANHEECTTYNIIFVTFWHIGETLNYYGALIAALATIAIAWFTLSLRQSTDKLWDAANIQSIHLGNEFVASHRPEMRLKHLWFIDDVWNGGSINVRLEAVNIGQNSAFIDIINFMTRMIPHGERLPQRPPYNEDGILQFPMGGFPLQSGVTFTHPVSDGRILTPQDIKAIKNGNARLYFIGTIAYRDNANRVRQTAFCRYLQFSSSPARADDNGRFAKDNDPDYEYQD